MEQIVCDTCNHADFDSIPQGIHSQIFAVGCNLDYDIEEFDKDTECPDHSEFIPDDNF